MQASGAGSIAVSDARGSLLWSGDRCWIVWDMDVLYHKTARSQYQRVDGMNISVETRTGDATSRIAGLTPTVISLKLWVTRRAGAFDLNRMLSDPGSAGASILSVGLSARQMLVERRSWRLLRQAQDAYAR